MRISSPLGVLKRMGSKAEESAMRTIAFVATGTAALLAGCTMEDRPSDSTRVEAARAEAQLAEELRGRQAGQPQACVQLTQLRGSRGIGPDVVLFEGIGGRVYVNRPAGGCRLRRSETLVTRTPTGRLCSGDVAQVVDVPTGPVGSCTLGPFVPYDSAP
jgi:hypothetical protein